MDRQHKPANSAAADHALNEVVCRRGRGARVFDELGTERDR
jgi:hypothetical protein